MISNSQLVSIVSPLSVIEVGGTRYWLYREPKPKGTISEGTGYPVPIFRSGYPVPRSESGYPVLWSESGYIVPIFPILGSKTRIRVPGSKNRIRIPSSKILIRNIGTKIESCYPRAILSGSESVWPSLVPVTYPSFMFTISRFYNFLYTFYKHFWYRTPYFYTHQSAYISCFRHLTKK